MLRGNEKFCFSHTDCTFSFVLDTLFYLFWLQPAAQYQSSPLAFSKNENKSICQLSDNSSISGEIGAPTMDFSSKWQFKKDTTDLQQGASIQHFPLILYCTWKCICYQQRLLRREYVIYILLTCITNYIFISTMKRFEQNRTAIHQKQQAQKCNVHVENFFFFSFRLDFSSHLRS